MLLYAVLLLGLGIVAAAAAAALWEGIRQRARWRGILLCLGAMTVSLLGIWLILV